MANGKEMEMRLDISKTKRMHIGEILDSLGEGDVKLLTDITNLFRSLPESQRLALLMVVIDKCTETHVQEMSLATSLIVNKITGHFKGDRKVLKATIEGLMQGVMHVEDTVEAENGIKKQN